MRKNEHETGIARQKNSTAIFLIGGIGAYLILKPWFDQRGLFGEAEER